MGWYEPLKPLNIFGLSSVQDEKRHIIWRVLWFFVVLIATGITIFLLYARVNKYFVKPVVTSISYEDSDELQFPTITICAEHLGTSMTTDKEDINATLWQAMKDATKKHNGVDIWKCKYGAIDCQHEIIKKPSDWGMCAELNTEGKLVSVTGGVSESLVAYVYYSGPAAYMHPEPSLGFRLSITEPGQKSMVMYDSISIGSNALTEVAMTLRNESLIQDCLSHGKDEELYDGKYSWSKCIYNCMSTVVGERFNSCCPPNEIKPGWFHCTKKVFCPMSEEQKFATFLANEQADVFNTCQLKCKRPCAMAYYDTRLTWQPLNKEVYEDFLEQYPNVELSDEEMRKRVALVSIFYRTLTYEKVQQSEQLTLAGLACDIGGVLSIWIGIKILGVVSMFEILIEKGLEWRKNRANKID